MPRQGLHKEQVIQAAIAFIDQHGLSRFSMGELAKYLNIRPSSLYNHVESLDELLRHVGLAAVSRLTQMEEEAIANKAEDEALFALAEAYRTFAREHYQLYKVIMGFSQWSTGQVMDQEPGKIVVPILRVLASYGLTKPQQYHWQRVLRAVMVGFALHEQTGGFSHFPADKAESYRIAIQCVADGLRRAGKENV